MLESLQRLQWVVKCRPRRLASCSAWTTWSWRPWTGSSCWRPKVTSEVGAVVGAAAGLAAPTAALPISSSTTTPAAQLVPRIPTAATRKTAMPLPPLPPPGADTDSTGDVASVRNNRYEDWTHLNPLLHTPCALPFSYSMFCTLGFIARIRAIMSLKIH